MMVVAKCPLRVSLVGGSTDLEDFIQTYGKGSVISFPSSLCVHITVHDNHRGKYIVNYSKKEEVESVYKIKNDIAREALKHFDVGPVTVTFNSDIISTGSGLATSSAYMNALVKALAIYTGKEMSDVEICKLSLKLERQFNKYTGYQDPYGCGIQGFKKIDFEPGKLPTFRFYESSFLTDNALSMHLIHTGIARKSGSILKTIDVEKSLPLLDLVDQMDNYIHLGDCLGFIDTFNKGWETKKTTSPAIVGNPEFDKWNEILENDLIKGVKLCGAGGGGYFLVFSLITFDNALRELDFPSEPIKITVNERGVTGRVV